MGLFDRPPTIGTLRVARPKMTRKPPSVQQSRRRVLAGLVGAVGYGSLPSMAAAAVPTPRASEGPFYPRPSMRLADVDNDLVRVAGRVEEAGGEVFTLRGTITDREGRALAGRRIEIWQCDLNGRYMHPGDRGGEAHDPAFQGFGHDITDEAGGYVFRTIKPAVYPGRAPHIHVKVLDGDRELLTTQFYIKDHAANARDFLFARLSMDQAASVSMIFIEGADGPEAAVDVIV